jgi:4-hydroxy-2-oxoheptanedioate aldolase
MRPNRLRQRLNAGEPSIGTQIMSPWPGVVEMIGHTGCFDYVEFLGEYTAYDLPMLDDLGRAVDQFDDFSAILKVDQEPRTFLAQRAIGSGFQNINFADVHSADEARECVSAVRAETPETGGRYGAAGRRFARFILDGGSPEYVQALEDCVVLLMIEKKEAVENLEEILSVKGVDMVIFGGSDYSMSIGKPGQARGSEITKVRDHVYRTALSMGVQPRGELRTPEDAKPLLDLGVRHFSIGSDMLILHQWWQESSATLRGMIDSA